MDVKHGKPVLTHPLKDFAHVSFRAGQYSATASFRRSDAGRIVRAGMVGGAPLPHEMTRDIDAAADRYLAANEAALDALIPKP
jgi:hypothetical protein